MSARQATVIRNTNETRISVSLNLDGTGKGSLNTGMPFLDHMLDQIVRHGLIDLDVTCEGDVHIDDHHSAEDTGITIGQAFAQALGDKKGIRRYGDATVPMDETLANAVVDLSGRPYLVYQVNLPKVKIGEFDVELVREFFTAFVNNSAMNLHVRLIFGDNVHHIVEACFKAFARAMDEATQLDERIKGVMSTKGTL